jgi:hypothetical protein
MRVSASLTIAFLTALAMGQSTQVIPIVDRSEIESTLQFSGTVSISEQFLGNELISWCMRQASARNISQKPILALVLTLEARGSDSWCAGTTATFENFWSQKRIEPEQVVPIWEEIEPSSRTSQPHTDPLQPPSEPKAEIRLALVQFADGSFRGDERAAKDLINARNSALTELQHLIQTYLHDGVKAFSDELAGVRRDWYPSAEIQRIAKTRGTEAAIEKVRYYLRIANESSLALHSPQAGELP